jgi:selenocysteine-specific elongation factor
MNTVRMTNIIVGTAGHIDHGKTALVRALTGIDTDRLEEEKRRGISIDLGFAHLEHAGFRFGFVDVPGHERFVRNMLAGVGGIDLVILVIAADESVKPQTREHFDICRLLGLERGVIALTKSDLADPDWVELVRLEVAEFTVGSFLENAPVVEVSSKTGAGLDVLRNELARLAAGVPPRAVGGPARLPIDRSFTLHGFGTVATGTLWAGAIHAEDELELLPAARRLRVRGLHVHGGSVPEATAGQRTAVNLAGIAPEEIERGMTLASPGLFQPTRVVDCSFRLLPSAAPLKHRAPVHLHAGTSETLAEVRLIESLNAVQPGSSTHLRLLLRDPLLLLPGDRFIVRRFSPVTTIGGGEVLDNQPPRRQRRAAAAERLARMEAESPDQRLARFAAESPFGTTVAELAARTGRAPEDLRRAAPAAGLLVLDAWITPEAAIEREKRLLITQIANFHSQKPLEPGFPKASLLLPAFFLDALLARAPEIVAEGETLRLASHRLNLKSDEDEALNKIEALFRDAALAVPPLAEALAQSGLDPNRARAIVQILLRQKRLIRVSQDLYYHTEALDQLKSALAVRKGQTFAVPEFKDWTGVSRKYAIPLLEFLDREKITRRLGDKRQVL